MNKTLVILNPHAAGGRSGKLWTQIEPVLWHHAGELVVAVTERPEDVAQHLETAYNSGIDRVISIGGDGTNHSLVNALVELRRNNPEGRPVSYGAIPVGTGRDFARGINAPMKVKEAAEWVANVDTKPTDIGTLHYVDADGNPQKEHFLNIASAGVGGDADRRVSAVKKRRPWTFIKAIVLSILHYQPYHVHVKVDGKDWFEGDILIIAVANGTTFGHGMKIAPDAVIDDGIFDVILVESASKLEILMTLRRVFDGSHLTHPAVHHIKAREIEVVCKDRMLGLDLDGEFAEGNHLKFTVEPGELQMLRS